MITLDVGPALFSFKYETSSLTIVGWEFEGKKSTLNGNLRIVTIPNPMKFNPFEVGDKIHAMLFCSQ